MYWKSDCTEPGALAQAVLWRNGRRIIPDCSGEAPASRPGSGQQFSAAQAEAAGLPPVKLYPNPSQGILTIELPASYAPATAIFYNLQGKVLLQQNLPGETYRISLPGFRPGLYIVEVSPSLGKRERFKLILAH